MASDSSSPTSSTPRARYIKDITFENWVLVFKERSKDRAAPGLSKFTILVNDETGKSPTVMLQAKQGDWGQFKFGVEMDPTRSSAPSFLGGPRENRGLCESCRVTLASSDDIDDFFKRFDDWIVSKLVDKDVCKKVFGKVHPEPEIRLFFQPGYITSETVDRSFLKCDLPLTGPETMLPNITYIRTNGGICKGRGWDFWKTDIGERTTCKGFEMKCSVKIEMLWMAAGKVGYRPVIHEIGIKEKELVVEEAFDFASEFSGGTKKGGGLFDEGFPARERSRSPRKEPSMVMKIEG